MAIPVDIQGVLLDYDGVIARTMEINLDAWRWSLGHFDSHLSAVEYFLLEGAPPRDVAAQFLPPSFRDDPSSISRAVQLKEARFLELAPSLRYYRGARMLVRLAVKLGLKIALITGASRFRLQSSNKPGFLRRFDAIVTAEDVARGKPDPEAFLLGANRLGLRPRDCLVVENAPLGISAAKSAGMRCLAITSTLNALELSEADVIFDSVEVLFYEWCKQNVDSKAA